MQVHYQNINIENLTSYSKYEVVERKGIGHPDTLADIIANTFSSDYTKFGLNKFGGLLNHNVDKVVLSGGTADITFGNGNQVNPIKCYLFGKITDKVGSNVIDIDFLFRLSVKNVFDSIFGDGTFENHNIQTIICTNSAIGAEHKREYYNPIIESELSNFNNKMTITDSAYCNVFAGYSPLEKLVIECENHINGKEFKAKYNQTGFDVKCLAVRELNTVDLTICIPFIANKTPTYEYYSSVLNSIYVHLTKRYSSNTDFNIVIRLNTKDIIGHGYLTLFGTALDKGDFGVVGRGNRYEGVISLNRFSGVEATAGKNPFRSTGKIYHEIANIISEKLYNKLETQFNSTIIASNGSQIGDGKLIITSKIDEEVLTKIIPKLTDDVFNNFSKIIMKIVEKDFIKEHKSRNSFLF